MKIIDIHAAITTEKLLNLLKEKLNPMFQQQKDSDIAFIVEKRNTSVEIIQPDLYEGFLFSIEPKGTELLITRSEHYVDDVNSLTLESVLNTLFEKLAGDGEVKLVEEG